MTDIGLSSTVALDSRRARICSRRRHRCRPRHLGLGLRRCFCCRLCCLRRLGLDLRRRLRLRLCLGGCHWL